jgi:hypothetical protein
MVVPVSTRRARCSGGWRNGLHYGAPGALLSVGGVRPPGAPEARAPQTRTVAKLTDRDLLCTGIACPYNVVLSDGRFDKELFTASTVWELGGPDGVPLKAQHRHAIGWAEVKEAPSAHAEDRPSASGACGDTVAGCL